MNEEIKRMLRDGETGLSSETIIYYLEGLGEHMMHRWGWRTPSDPSDLWRCLRVLEASSDYKIRFHELAAISPEWALLVKHWDELEAMYRQEYGSGRAPKTYAMQNTLEALGLKSDLTCPICGKQAGPPDWSVMASHAGSMRSHGVLTYLRMWTDCDTCGRHSYTEGEIERRSQP